MNKDEYCDEENFEDIPIERYEYLESALFGILEDRGEDSGYCCRFFPDFDLTCAPEDVCRIISRCNV
jgi:hypothetical protein